MYTVGCPSPLVPVVQILQKKKFFFLCVCVRGNFYQPVFSSLKGFKFFKNLILENLKNVPKYRE